MHADVRRMIEMLKGEGWVDEGLTGENHPMLRWPATGEVLTMPLTPSDHRSLKNALAHARRVSGVRPEPHKSPSFKKGGMGSGFDLDAAKREAESRRHHADRLSRELTDIENRIIDLNPRRDRAQILRLATEHTHLSRRLKANGGTA